MVRVWRLWYVLCDGRSTHCITAAARIVRRSPYTMQKDEKGGV